jgi:hypothetical protein
MEDGPYCEIEPELSEISRGYGGMVGGSAVASAQLGMGEVGFGAPLHLTGLAQVSYAVAGSQISPRAEAQFSLRCGSAAFVAFSCGSEDLVFDQGEPIDATVDVLVPFSFDEEVAFERSVRVSAGFVPPFDGSDPNGSAEGLVELLLVGTWEKATVLDAEGHEVAATIQSASGFDYFNPVPEPQAVDLETAATGVLLVGGARRAARRRASAVGPRCPRA